MCNSVCVFWIRKPTIPYTMRDREIKRERVGREKRVLERKKKRERV